MTRHHDANHATMTASEPAPARELVSRIDHRLPQTQCTSCDYPSCLDYAHAIANGAANINACPPGGEVTIHALSRLTNREVLPLNPENGIHQPLQLAFINEHDCIGCKLCIEACPVDCIVGAGKLMHTVIATDCSGCELCVAVCPTDCITLVAPPKSDSKVDDNRQPPSIWLQFNHAQVEKSRTRARQKRERETAHQHHRAAQKSARAKTTAQQEIRAALQRKQATARVPT